MGIKFKPFLPPFCVSRVELRDEIVSLIFAYSLLSLSYPGDEYVTEEHREMFTDT